MRLPLITAEGPDVKTEKYIMLDELMFEKLKSAVNSSTAAFRRQNRLQPAGGEGRCRAFYLPACRANRHGRSHSNIVKKVGDWQIEKNDEKGAESSSGIAAGVPFPQAKRQKNRRQH